MRHIRPPIVRGVRSLSLKKGNLSRSKNASMSTIHIMKAPHVKRVLYATKDSRITVSVDVKFSREILPYMKGLLGPGDVAECWRNGSARDF